MATISPVAAPSINWSARNLSTEFQNFSEMVDLMFAGPLVEKKDEDQAKFSYISLWGVRKQLNYIATQL